MTNTTKKDALARKKRFVESLTHSHQFMTDEHFLQPDTASERPSKQKKRKVADAEKLKLKVRSSSTKYY